MGLMAIEDEQKRRALAQMQPEKKGWLSKRLAVSLILILLILNVGAVYWMFNKAKASADSLEGINNPGSFSIPGIRNTGNLPKTDVTGEDPSDVKRYSNSVRTDYQNSGELKVEYKTKDSVSVVLGYYKSELALTGWILQYSDPGKIIFVKEDKKITISAINKDGLTTFTFIE